jgi:hypothetical protein
VAADIGTQFTYRHPNGAGYGEHALGQPLSAEMTELDLQDGMTVYVLEYDADSGWPLVEWTDTKGLGRITTIDPAIFDTYFVPA